MPRWILRSSGLLVSVVMLLSGCAQQAVMLPTPVPPVIRQEASLHLPASPQTLDLAKVTDAATLDLVGNLLEGLVRTAGGAIFGAAAERWEWTGDREVTFYLRPEARWSDGLPLTAAEFVQAWERLLDPRTDSVHAYRFYEIRGAEEWSALNPTDPDFEAESALRRANLGLQALDHRTLQVTLREPNPQWVAYTAHPAFLPFRADLTLSQEALRAGESHFVGNGPFLIERWTADGEIRLRRNPTYWDGAAVQMEGLTFRSEGDGQAALRLFEMGQLDHAILPAELVAGMAEVEAMAQPSTMGLVFNTSQPRLASSTLRRAIYLALDRKRLAYEVAGQSALPSAGLIPPSLGGGWQPAGEPAPVQGDPLQARKLWEAARAELNLTQMTVRLLHARETTGLARSIQSMLQSNLDGLIVELHTVPFDQRLERVRYGQFDLVLQGVVAEHDDPLSLLEIFTTANPGNDPRWINGDYDSLIAEARRADGQERSALLADAERLLLHEAPVLPLYHPVRHWLIRSDLKGLQYSPMGLRIDLRRAYRGSLTKGAADRREGNPHGG